MTGITDRILRAGLGTSDLFGEGRRRTLRGLREGDDRQLYIGLTLLALRYLRRTKPRKRLIYRKALPEGTALVIHHRSSGQPRLEIVKPKRR
jgi:hypothetical protein